MKSLRKLLHFGKATQYGTKRRRLHQLFDLLIDKFGPDRTMEIMQEWAEDYEVNTRAHKEMLSE